MKKFFSSFSQKKKELDISCKLSHEMPNLIFYEKYQQFVTCWSCPDRAKHYLFLHKQQLLLSADITFANSLDPDQAWQNVGPDRIQTVWHSDDIPERFFLKKFI